MADSAQQIIAAQAREIEQLKAARHVPNTAAADMAGILNFSNTALQSNKQDLEEKNATLTQHNALLAHRNAWLEGELVTASHLLKQTIPGEQDVKQQNTTLQQRNQSLEAENTLLQSEITALKTQYQTTASDLMLMQQQFETMKGHQTKLLTEHEALHNICKQWSFFSAQQGAEIEFHKGNAMEVHGSLVRKAWRLHIQKTYLDKAGLVVKEFEKIDEDVIGAWAEENIAKMNGAPGVVDGKVAAAEVVITPVETKFPMPRAKQLKFPMPRAKQLKFPIPRAKQTGGAAVTKEQASGDAVTKEQASGDATIK